jgi:predicted dehydrogenase
MDVDVLAIASPSGPQPFIDQHELDASAYTDAKSVCEDTAIDFLDICTPTDTHPGLIEAAAANEVDAFLEKPIARDLVAAHDIATTVERSGITVMVGHVLRFHPAYERARALVEDGAIGAPGVARARRLSPFPTWGADDWYTDRARSGGVFLDLAIHDLDFLRSIWGPVDSVFARRTREDALEHGTVTLRFQNGATGYVEASWAQSESRDLTSELELAGDDGVVGLSSDEKHALRTFTADDREFENPLSDDGYLRELSHFVDCLETGTEPAVTIEDGMAALRLALAASRSVERGVPVSPDEVDA